MLLSESSPSMVSGGMSPTSLSFHLLHCCHPFLQHTVGPAGLLATWKYTVCTVVYYALSYMFLIPYATVGSTQSQSNPDMYLHSGCKTHMVYDFCVRSCNDEQFHCLISVETHSIVQGSVSLLEKETVMKMIDDGDDDDESLVGQAATAWSFCDKGDGEDEKIPDIV